MAGPDKQMMNRPALVVHYKVSDVADRSFGALDVVTAKGICASQMGIATTVTAPTIDSLLTRRDIRHRKTSLTPQPFSFPIGWPSIVTIILLFVLSRDWLMRLNYVTIFNLMPSEIHEQTIALLTKVPKGMGRDQHQTP